MARPIGASRSRGGAGPRDVRGRPLQRRTLLAFRRLREPGDDGEQLAGVDGLGDVRLKARRERPVAVFRTGIRAEGNRRKSTMLMFEFPQPADQSVAIVAGYSDVGLTVIEPQLRT